MRSARARPTESDSTSLLSSDSDEDSLSMGHASWSQCWAKRKAVIIGGVVTALAAGLAATGVGVLLAGGAKKTFVVPASLAGVLGQLADVAEAMELASGRAEEVAVSEAFKKQLRTSRVDADRLAQVMGEAFERQSVETAILNGILITVQDIAELEGGNPEDHDRSGSFHAHTPAGVPEEQRRLKEVGGGAAWKDAKINFCFAPEVAPLTQHMFRLATRLISRSLPCLNFEEVDPKPGSNSNSYTAETGPWTGDWCQTNPSIFVTSQTGEWCYSLLGMSSSSLSQVFSLGSEACNSLGMILHELGHALGLAHEQQRPDRDRYIKILWDNIDNGYRGQWIKESVADTSVPYDYMSIMHYGLGSPRRFAMANGQPVPELIGVWTGQRVGLAHSDVEQLQKKYVKEDSACKINPLLGMGCVDKPKGGNDICGSVEPGTCSEDQLAHCCRCSFGGGHSETGGLWNGQGVAVSCYQGEECPHGNLVYTVHQGHLSGEVADLLVAKGTVRQAKEQCATLPGCVGFTLNGTGFDFEKDRCRSEKECDEAVMIWFASKFDHHPSSSWTTYKYKGTALNKYSRHSGWLADGNDIEVAQMTLEEAATNCDLMRECVGFTHHGGGEGTPWIHFMNHWHFVAGEGWTSYEKPGGSGRAS